MSVRIIISLSAAPGRGADFAKAFRARGEEVVNEPGCEQFEVFQSTIDSDRLVLVELWKDQAALDAHAKMNTTRTPLPADLFGGGSSREDYEYRKVS